jgi:hypothetical protein
MPTRNSELRKRNEEPSSEINSLNFQKGSHPEIFLAAELAGSISQSGGSMLTVKSIIANAAKPHRPKQQSRWKPT